MELGYDNLSRRRQVVGDDRVAMLLEFQARIQALEFLREDRSKDLRIVLACNQDDMLVDLLRHAP